MIYHIEPDENLQYADDTIWWWITSELTGEVGWIVGNKGQITDWCFLGQHLDPKVAIHDKKIQRICPDLINLMIVCLTHQE